MANNRDIDKIRRVLFDNHNTGGAFYGKVLSCDESSRSCVIDADGLTYEDVALFAVDSGTLPGAWFLPKKDSIVLVSRIDISNELYVAMFSEVDKAMLSVGKDMTLVLSSAGMELNVSKTLIKAEASGVIISRGNSGLKKTLEDLCDAIKSITVPTGIGASGMPVNAMTFDTIKQDLNQYLK